MSGGSVEALQRQTHVLLPNEQSFYYTFSCIQQICEGNLDRKAIKRLEFLSMRKSVFLLKNIVTHPTFLLSRDSDSLILFLWNQLSLLVVRRLALFLHVSVDRKTNKFLFCSVCLVV